MSRNMSKEGRRNAAKAQSSIISDLLNDNINFRTELERKGIQPKNHHKDNLRYIRDIQQKTKEKQSEKEREIQQKNKRFLLPKFANIDSKIKIPKETQNEQPIKHNNNNNNIQNTNDNNDNNNNSTVNHILQNKMNVRNISNYNSVNNSTIDSGNITTNRSTNSLKMKRKQDIPSKQELLKIDEMMKNSHNLKSNENYISKNRQNAIDCKPKQNEKTEIRYINKENYGKIPDYIIQRRLELAEKHQKELEEKERNKIPKGMKKMAEIERIETLELLAKNKNEVELAIQKLPLRIETPSMIKHEKNLRKQLKEIENAIKIFSKKTVLIVDSDQTEP